ncbi:AMP-binding protein [Quisquiliibacterium transsilvanicum]|uniref:Acetyl-CoA synthetase n=1 Tax=Quisquiliibacterium transsilvanicum TaxID=1549638 RepID=A0A7W8HKR5_9BURK|nr:AMP-binding protein [Quisquiliibacterium transsilvanicum]MBB5272978.1 acetyl-CoA synthetase [Quisquiliibacterium transsilvanicum]
MSELQRFLAARDHLLATRTDYAAAVAGFAWPRLESFNWALDYFDAIARGNDAPALHIVEESGSEARLSYAQLSARSSQVAGFLARHGARRGDRILLMLGNEVPLWESMLAAIKLGAVLIPATTLLSGDDLADRLQRGNVRHIITNEGGASRVDELPAAVLAGISRIFVGDGARPGWIAFADSAVEPAGFRPEGATRADDPLLEYFTSGTTARPKLVRHTHQSYPVGHLSTMYWLGLQRGDVHWTISSPGWAKHAWSCFFAPFNAQACVFIYNYSRFSGPAILETLVKHEVNTLCAPPTVWRMLIQENLAGWPVKLRELISAGEPLNPEVIEQVRVAWNITIRDGYGQTETTAQIGNPPGAPVKSGSMGRPLPGYPIVLLDPDGAPAEEGEICIDLSRRPVALMTAYADDDEKTAEVMRDGHYHTGDVGMRDAEGYITYVGRADDVFKASGYRISPFELESVLIEHPAVAEAAVVPSPDPVRGYVPKAYVITAPGHAPGPETAASIFRFLRERVSGYKLVRRIEFSDLPKTISGKIRRVELRRQETDRPDHGPRNELEFLEEQFR